MGKGCQGAVRKAGDEVCLRWVRSLENFRRRPRYLFRRYCFGAPYVCDQLAGDVCSSGAFAHPAFLTEHHFVNLKSKGFSEFSDGKLSSNVKLQNRSFSHVQKLT
jgi:hypothetical protein